MLRACEGALARCVHASAAATDWSWVQFPPSRLNLNRTTCCNLWAMTGPAWLKSDEDLECEEPKAYVVVCSKAGKENSAFTEALDVLILSEAKPVLLKRTKTGGVFVFSISKDAAGRARALFKRGCAAISNVLYGEKVFTNMHELEGVLKSERVSIMIREKGDAFKDLQERSGSKASVLEVFEECAFLCTQKWV